MSLREYAELQRRFGTRVREHAGQYWRRVRPFLYRPLLPVESLDPASLARPVPWPSAYQFVARNGAASNSTMNFLLLTQPGGYGPSSLTHKRRQLIRRAGDFFRVQRVTEPELLKRDGHRVYLSFFQRTRYPYRSDRRAKPTFDAWVDALFSNHRAIVLGAFGAEGLAAISTSYWVNDTLLYSTLMCDSAAMRLNVSELVFHEIQTLAANEPGIRRIVVRSYQGGNTLDQYYLHRGCTLARFPARIEISAPVQLLLRWLLPRKYELLFGEE